MKYKWILLFVSILALTISADTGEYGVKEIGAGLSGVARYRDAGTVLLNPASVGLIRANCFTASYSRLAWGIGSSKIERGMGSYVFRRQGIGAAALSFTILNQDISYYSRLGLTITPELRIFGRQTSLGITGNWYQTGYRPSQFEGHDIGPDPIFEEGTQKDAFGVSAGLMTNIYRDLWFGFVARDINEPNLAFQDTVGYGKRPLEIQGGFYYPVDWFLKPSLSLLWRNETINEKDFIRLRAGTEAYLPRGIRMRAGYDGTGLDFGMTLHAGSLFGGMDIDYALVYPLEKDLAEAGALSHHFGLTVWGIERRPKTVDLVAESISPKGNLMPGVKGEIVGMFYNRGKERSEGFSVTLAVQDPAGKWKIVYPVKYLDGMTPDSMAALSWQWKPEVAGSYTIRMTIDDDGRNMPEINGVIDERKEDNNSVEKIVEAIFAGEMEFALAERKGWVTRVDYLMEEMPLVPIIFHEPGDIEIDSVETEMLKIYAERLGFNPDARLVIEGFFDPSDEVACTAGAELAMLRAESVRDLLIEIAPQLESQIKIANQIECAEPVYRIDPAKVSRDSSLIAEENRRTELSTEFPNIEKMFAEYELPTGQLEMPPHIEFDDSAVAILKRNEHAVILIEGGFAEGEDSVSGLLRADKLRAAIRSFDPTILAGKIRLVPGWNGPRVKAIFTGEGILWSPTLSLPSIMAYENLEPPVNTIFVTTRGFEGAKVDSSMVDIISPGGNHIRNIYRGPGLPPSEIGWDWLDEGGHLITPDSWVRVRGVVYIDGSPLVYRSEGKEGRMCVRVKDVQRRISKLLVVQFVFDEDAPTSHYLESRLDGLANDIIHQAIAKLSPMAGLKGHTDAIGKAQYNMQLSIRRSDKELKVLRLYMMHYLEAKNSAELDSWLAEKGVSISSEGFGANRPYTIQSITAEGIPTILGDNATPRGRTVNRRVTVEHSLDEESKYRNN